MARTTTNYGFNISEGSDIVNPLTDIFPNFESLDTDLKDVSDATFGVATELKSGTVHALTRDDKDKNVFKFTATSNFTAGDTFTVDGEQVSALTTSGEQLSTGCYVIGSEVIVAKKGTLLTFFISNVVTDATTLEGHSASYFATASDLSDTDANVLAVSNKVGSAVLTTEAQDCSGAINELNNGLSKVGFPNYSNAVTLQAGTTYTATENVFVSGSAYNTVNGAVRITLTVYDASDNVLIGIINSGTHTPGSVCGSSVSLPIKRGFKYRFDVDGATSTTINAYKYD